MSTPPLTIDEFKSSLVDRYLQPLEHPHSRVDLERLLEERGVFQNAAIFSEYVEQLRSIFARLNSMLSEHGIIAGSDLSAQALGMCDELLEYGQRLPLSLPQAVVEESARKPNVDGA